MRKFISFLVDEEGSIVESLVKYLIIGLGGATIMFGILEAMRIQGGKIIDGINSINF